MVVPILSMATLLLSPTKANARKALSPWSQLIRAYCAKTRLLFFSELVAGAEDYLLLSGAEISDIRTKILLAEIGITIFAADEDIVG